ncbi:MAG: hypothetical protein Q7J27_09280 [Syntrophales bacterium]|nr:hypothetical protein [Syntrophales bacterium]
MLLWPQLVIMAPLHGRLIPNYQITRLYPRTPAVAQGQYILGFKAIPAQVEVNTEKRRPEEYRIMVGMEDLPVEAL